MRQKLYTKTKQLAYLFLLPIVLLLLIQSSGFAQYEHVVLNELSGDGGNIEAGNDAIVELAGPPGADIGCMLVTNTEWAVVLPAGTKIPSDGVFVIGCEERDNRSTGFYTGLSTGLSCDVCDFPGLVVDFDVCNVINANYVSPSIYTTYGFTLDNISKGGNKDGDQVILFQPDGAAHDAVYWGASDNTNARGGTITISGASGFRGAPSDHVSVQIGQSYTLGDNDENGVINDNVGTHQGYRGNGGNAVGVNILPSGNDDLGNPEVDGLSLLIPPGDCNAHLNTYTVPSLADPIWVNLGLSLVSCNSTHIRLNDSSPSGNSHQIARSSTNSSHQDDPDLNADWVSFLPSDLVPSSIDQVRAAEQWQVTNHPNPGEPNDVDSWDFFYDAGAGLIEIFEKEEINISLCNSQVISFELRVYNYQHVEPTVRSARLAGSFVRDEVGDDQAWTISKVGHTKTVGDSPSDNDGVTTLQFTSNTLEAGKTHSFLLVWDDFTDCCGSSSNNTVVRQSNPHECYERIKVNIAVAETISISDNSIACPGDLATGVGFIDASTLLSRPNANVRYELKGGIVLGDELTTGTIVASNLTGTFNLSNNFQTPLAIIIKDLANCGADQIINIEDNCLGTPPCPEINASKIDVSSSDICPNSQVCFDITDFQNLPDGGFIDYYWANNSTFNPYRGEGAFLGSAKITNTTSSCPTGQVYIASSDRRGNGDECGADGEFIEICHAGCSCGSDIDLSGWEVEDRVSQDGSPATTVNISSGILKPGECIKIFSGYLDNTLADNPTGSMGSPFIIDADREACPVWNNSSDDILLYNGDSQAGGNLVDEETYSSAGLITYDTPSITCPTIFVEQFCYTFDDSFCNKTQNGDFFVKAIINPFTTFDDPTNQGNAGDSNDCFGEDAPRFELFSLNMNCPSADLIVQEIQKCQSDINDSDTMLLVELSNIAGLYDIVINLQEGNTIIPLKLENQRENPLAITYTQISTLLGMTFDISASLASIANRSGTACSGSIDTDEVGISVKAIPTGTIMTTQDPSDCTSDGAVTFSFSPADSGPWEFEYQINNSNPISTATNKPLFTLPATIPGSYVLSNLINESGCSGTVNTTAHIIDNIATLSLQSVGERTICAGRGELVDLNEDILFEIVDENIILRGNALTIGNIVWCASDPSFLPEILRPTISLTNTSFTPTNSRDYYFIYQRPSDGCELIGSTMVNMVSDCSQTPSPSTNSPQAPENIPTLSQWGIIIFGLLILNLSLIFIRRLHYEQ